MKNLLKLPLRIAVLPLIAILLVFQLISSLIVGLTSIVTNLLAAVFLIGSVAGWIANAPRGRSSKRRALVSSSPLLRTLPDGCWKR